MDRAGFQLAVTGFAGLAVHGRWRYLEQRIAAQALTELLAIHTGQSLLPLLEGPLLGVDAQQCRNSAFCWVVSSCCSSGTT